MAEGKLTRRQVIKSGAAASLALVAGGTLANRTWAADPIRIGLADAFSGVYAAEGRNERNGAMLALEEVNARGGVLSRPLELLSEDAEATTSVAVQRLRKLIQRDGVDFTMGAVSSGVSLALMQVANQFGKVHIVTGGHADSITGSDCMWNAFRIPTNGNMEANAIGPFLAEEFGKRWYICTPDYAYGWSLQEAFTRVNEQVGGEIVGVDRVPLGTNDYSPQLLKVARAQPDVFLAFQAGTDAVAILKQITQFGLDKRMAIAGGLQEYESIAALPPEARIGWWTFEWYYAQTDVPEVKAFVDKYRGRYGHVPTARSWFGYVAVHSLALAVDEAKSLDAQKVARALEGLSLPPSVALDPHEVYYRAGDHQLINSVFVGEVRQGEDPDDIFQVARRVPGEEVALPVDQTGCTIKYPA